MDDLTADDEKAEEGEAQIPLEELLLNAAEDGDKITMAQTLRDGAKPNCRDRMGWTPLLWCCFNGDAVGLKMLIDAGAKVDNAWLLPTVPTSSNAPLDNMRDSLAGELGNGDVDIDEPDIPRKDEGALQQHLVFSSKNRTKKHFGETALNCAAFRGHEMVLSALLEAGADIKLAGNYGNSVLHAAASGGHTNCVQLLLEYGSSVNSKNKNGCVPSQVALRDDNRSLIREAAAAKVCMGTDKPFTRSNPRTMCYRTKQFYALDYTKMDMGPEFSRPVRLCLHAYDELIEQRRKKEEERRELERQETAKRAHEEEERRLAEEERLRKEAEEAEAERLRKEAEEAERQRLLEEERQEALRKLQEEEEAKRNKGKKGKGKKK